MSIDGRTYHSAGYSQVMPGDPDRPSYVCPIGYIPADGGAVRMARARFREANRDDFEADGEYLVDAEGQRWERVKFVPSGDLAEGVQLFFLEGRWMAHLRPAGFREHEAVVTPPSRVIEREMGPAG